LQAFNITKDSDDPQGGKIGRDPKTGLPNGVLYDSATNPVWGALLRNSPYAVENLALYRHLVPYLNSLGVTSILDALTDDDMERAYYALDAQGGLTMHVSMAFRMNPDDYRTEIPRIASKRASQTAHTSVDYVKVLGDGNLEDGLADMLQPYGLATSRDHRISSHLKMPPPRAALRCSRGIAVPCSQKVLALARNTCKESTYTKTEEMVLDPTWLFRSSS
jgi:predicted amidohydrolase YtcJ